MVQTFIGILAGLTASSVATTIQNCSSEASLASHLPGGEITSFTANSMTNYTSTADSVAIDFCNVTITYTHPGWNDSIHVFIWLPLTNWNGRLQGIGGGGYSGLQDFSDHATAVAAGYSAVGSDLGHDMNITWSSEAWSLDASGKVNLFLLTDFASVGLNDAANLGKAATKNFYGIAPRTYWNGCSTGGRQGLMLAQRYPSAYDGILAGAPAINWGKFIIAEYWPQFVMDQLNTYPPPCVLDYVNKATIHACDTLDGTADNIISLPQNCTFDPQTLVGETITCNSTNHTISQDDALIVQKVWQGMEATDGTPLWPGLFPGAKFDVLANTLCSTSDNCTSDPFPISTDWISRFVLQDPFFDFSDMSYAQYESIFYQSDLAYDAIIGTDSTDLRDFKLGGGKIVHWHGLADQYIFPKGSEDYYNRVKERFEGVGEWYRYFEAPGVEHCSGGVGPAPANGLDALVEWVERGIAPEVLKGVSEDGTLERDLCVYPQVAVYKGGDVNVSSSFVCEGQ